VSGLDSLWFQLLVGALAGYLTGAIPFGFLVYRWATGTDIRTVGSGNIGATNVGRLLGFRFFVLVFLLDLLKGFVPVLGVPLVLRGLGMTPPADLGLFVALAAILGHNFPVYLGFKGGKGVATSLGALLALEPLSCAAAAVGFFLVFFLTRYVSLSSIAGAFGFVAGHFLRIKDPWNKTNLAMSLLAIAIAVLILIRHHKNIIRIVQGTEPKVPLRRGGAKE
jgi:glycerol-3-phosphate acyltransferase PlsY